MNGNYIFEDVNAALPYLLQQLLRAGEEVGSRAGRTKELTHVGITLKKPWRREVLVEHRKPSIAAQIAETMWMLGGRNDIEWLSHYLPRAGEFSDDGETWRAGYGARLRRWGYQYPDEIGSTDQLAYVVDTLRRDPGSRQAVMSIWDPATDKSPGKDIPCNDWLHFLSRLGHLDLHVAIRSNDIVWGWSGINQFEWSALLEIVAGLTGLKVGRLHFSTTSLHLYEHHWEKAQKIADSETMVIPAIQPNDSPRFNTRFLDGSFVSGEGDPSLEAFDSLVKHWFDVEFMIRTNSSSAPAYIDAFPEPMLQSWLRVIGWWWEQWWSDAQADAYIAPLEGMALHAATRYSVQPPTRKAPGLKPSFWAITTDPIPVGSQVYVDENHVLQVEPPVGTVILDPVEPGPQPSPFLQYVIQLHNEKHAAYGDSWKRRGEMLGILANIARKIDRLGGGETADETSADTAIDLFVYLAKMKTWLWDQETGAAGNLSDHPTPANDVMIAVEKEIGCVCHVHPGQYIESLTSSFDHLERESRDRVKNRAERVSDMLKDAYSLARYLWTREQPSDEYQGADVD